MSVRMKRLWAALVGLTVIGCGMTAWLWLNFEPVQNGSPLAELVNRSPMLMLAFMGGTLVCFGFLVWEAGSRERRGEGR